MNLKDTCKAMTGLLESIQADLAKAEAGNKAAAQRVRTHTIRLEKVAKVYRKESIKAEKSGVMNKKKEAVRKAKATSKTKPTSARKVTKTKPKSKPAPKKAAPKALERRRPTAKLPKKERKKK